MNWNIFSLSRLQKTVKLGDSLLGGQLWRDSQGRGWMTLGNASKDPKFRVFPHTGYFGEYSYMTYGYPQSPQQKPRVEVDFLTKIMSISGNYIYMY